MTREERKRLSAALKTLESLEGGSSYLLVIVEAMARNATIAAKSVEWTHGGKRARKLIQSEVPAPDPEMAALGPLVSIEYFANKGEGGSFVYRHDFESPTPILVYNKKGKLLIAGGGYTVNSRGIVG